MTLGLFSKEVTKEMRASRLGVFFMSLGMVIAVLSITLITSLGEGTRIKITEILEQLNFGSNAFLLLAGGGKFFGPAQTLEDIETISRYDFVIGVSPDQFAFRPVSYKGRVYKTRINGVMPQWAPLAHWGVIKGRFITKKDLKERAKVAVLGWKTAKDLFGDTDPLGKYVKVSGTLFKVIGVLESKGSVGRHPLDLRVVIPLTTSQRRLLNRDWLDAAKIVISPNRDVHKAQRLIAQLLRRRHHLVPPKPDDFRIITSEQIIAFLTKATHTLTVMLLLIGTISLVVSGIIITNIMLAVITQRRRIIGIRRALGATKREIMLHYTVFSLSVSLIGGIIGMSLGIALAKAVAQISPIPARAPWYIFVVAPLFSLMTGGIFGLHPARKAAQMSPVDSLR